MTGIHDSLIVIDGLVIAKWSRAVFADMRKGGLTGANCTCSIWDLRLEQVRNRLRAGGSSQERTRLRNGVSRPILALKKLVTVVKSSNKNSFATEHPA